MAENKKPSEKQNRVRVAIQNWFESAGFITAKFKALRHEKHLDRAQAALETLSSQEYWLVRS
jgi:hypothetical protein